MSYIVNTTVENSFSGKAKLGISACLLGQKVRYDGGHKQDYFLTETVGRCVEWVPVCPELEVGMGVPREPVRLVGNVSDPRMIAERSGKDWTGNMQRFASRRVRALKELELSGYIFKKDSPSCGMERVRVYNRDGIPNRAGRGLFASAVMSELPLLPVEEEGRLNDPILRENFIERIFAYHRWQQHAHQRKSVRSLVDFHTRHKLLVLAHSEPHYRKLGRIVAEAKQSPIAAAYEQYSRLFMEAMSRHATAKKHSNVLEHMMGYFSKQLSKEERQELLELINDFRQRLIPLVVPLTLFRHYVKKYRVTYLENQIYLQPSPKELMLRNHV
jgi:uncharacterized protein YbgA (DUF1722 family)/uncharacterized protein YbbK (DUF523 family)